MDLLLPQTPGASSLGALHLEPEASQVGWSGVLAGCHLGMGRCISLMPSASFVTLHPDWCLCGAIIARILGLVAARCLRQCLSQCTHREGTACPGDAE